MQLRTMEEETTDSFLRCSSSSSTMSLLNRVLASHQPLHQMSSPQYIDAQREKILRALDFLFSSGKMQVTFESALEILDMTLSSSDVGLSSSPKGLLGSSTSPLRIVRANPSNRVAYVVQSSSGVSGEEYVCFQSYCSCRDFYNQLTNKLKVEDAVCKHLMACRLAPFFLCNVAEEHVSDRDFAEFISKRLP